MKLVFLPTVSKKYSFARLKDTLLFPRPWQPQLRPFKSVLSLAPPPPVQPYHSSAESENGDDDDDAGADVYRGAASAGGEEADPHAPLPPAASRHGVSVMAPSFDGRDFSRDRGGRNAVWNADGGGLGGHGGSAAPLFAPILCPPPPMNPNFAGLADDLHGTWLPSRPEHGAPGSQGQQRPQFLRFRGHGADMAGGRFSGGRFSPPQGEAAPFKNW